MLWSVFARAATQITLGLAIGVSLAALLHFSTGGWGASRYERPGRSWRRSPTKTLEGVQG